MSIIQVVVIPVTILLVFHAKTAQSVAAGGVCSATSDCDANLNLVCNKAKTSCASGTCSCNTGNMLSGNKCVPIAYLGQTCDTLYVTKNGQCTGSKVSCAAGYTEVSNVLCTNAVGKVLGEACATATDTCYYYQASVAAYDTAVCTNQVCVCPTGLLKSGTNCRNKIVGDACTGSAECIGSTCVSSKCACNSGETLYNGACYVASDYSLKEGETCGTGTNNCGPNLRCLICEGDTTGTCSAGSARFADIFTILSVSLVTMARFLF